MKTQTLHQWLGWIGSMIALGDYGLFAAGYIPDRMFFSIGVVAGFFLIIALKKDKAYYAVFMQMTFIILNIIGVVRSWDHM